MHLRADLRLCYLLVLRMAGRPATMLLACLECERAGLLLRCWLFLVEL